MSRHAQPLLARRWRSLMLAAVLLMLSGAVLLVWLRIDAEAHRADQLGAKADRLGVETERRGTAVTTLAADVRILRKQVKAQGGTPAAPDPARAVEDLPDRAAPVPGERGAQGPAGEPGKNGRDGADGTNGEDGAPGVNGADGAAGEPGPSGPPGPPGADGKDGTDGKNGRDGTDGQNCPAGYSLQPPPDDPDALVCRRTNAPAPDPSDDAEPVAAGLDPQRRQYA